MLSSHLRARSYRLGEFLYDTDEPLRYLFFPVSGVISLQAVLGDGSGVEVGTVGSEGMVGSQILMALRESANMRAVCQMPCQVLLLPVNGLIAWLGGRQQLPDVLMAYFQVQLIETMQSVACNRLHRLTQRCARSLLVSHDRIHSDQLPMTHEFMAQMLGSRRASVTTALGRLQASGAISYRRGQVVVVDRELLEDAACECYEYVRSAREQLTPPPATWLAAHVVREAVGAATG